MTAQQAAFERELRDQPATVERILETFPPAEQERERVIIKCDEASVDAAIFRALALAVDGIEARIELIEENDAE